MLVSVNVEVPKNLTSSQKKQIIEFESKLNDKNYKTRKSFFERLKSVFE